LRQCEKTIAANAFPVQFIIRDRILSSERRSAIVWRRRRRGRRRRRRRTRRHCVAGCLVLLEN
jgi:hypothetical protein